MLESLQHVLQSNAFCPKFFAKACGEKPIWQNFPKRFPNFLHRPGAPRPMQKVWEKLLKLALVLDTWLLQAFAKGWDIFVVASQQILSTTCYSLWEWWFCNDTWLAGRASSANAALRKAKPGLLHATLSVPNSKQNLKSTFEKKSKTNSDASH